MEDSSLNHKFKPCPHVSGCLACIQHPELCHASVSESRLCGKVKELHRSQPEDSIERYLIKVKNEMSAMNLTYMQAIDLINFITIRARKQ